MKLSLLQANIRKKAPATTEDVVDPIFVTIALVTDASEGECLIPVEDMFI
jgi:hypothetical protein